MHFDTGCLFVTFKTNWAASSLIKKKKNATLNKNSLDHLAGPVRSHRIAAGDPYVENLVSDARWLIFPHRHIIFQEKILMYSEYFSNPFRKKKLE